MADQHFAGAGARDVGGVEGGRLARGLPVAAPCGKLSGIDAVVAGDLDEEIGVELGELTEEVLTSARRSDPGEASGGSLGLRLQELTPELASRLRYDEGTGVGVVAVRRDSRAFRRGFRQMDIILEINTEPLQSIDDCERILDELESGTAVMFLVRGRRETRFISLRLP